MSLYQPIIPPNQPIIPSDQSIISLDQQLIATESPMISPDPTKQPIVGQATGPTPIVANVVINYSHPRSSAPVETSRCRIPIQTPLNDSTLPINIDLPSIIHGEANQGNVVDNESVVDVALRASSSRYSLHNISSYERPLATSDRRVSFDSLTKEMCPKTNDECEETDRKRAVSRKPKKNTKSKKDKKSKPSAKRAHKKKKSKSSHHSRRCCCSESDSYSDCSTDSCSCSDCWVYSTDSTSDSSDCKCRVSSRAKKSAVTASKRKTASRK